MYYKIIDVDMNKKENILKYMETHSYKGKASRLREMSDDKIKKDIVFMMFGTMEQFRITEKKIIDDSWKRTEHAYDTYYKKTTHGNSTQFHDENIKDLFDDSDNIIGQVNLESKTYYISAKEVERETIKTPIGRDGFLADDENDL